MFGKMIRLKDLPGHTARSNTVGSGTSSTLLVLKGQGWARLGAMISRCLLHNSRRSGTIDLKTAQELLTGGLKDPYSSKF